jgi:hypothetical protein
LTEWAEKYFGKIWVGQMENEDNSSIEDNLPMVNYIMLARIYDLLTLIASKIATPDEVAKMVGYHEQGYILGPNPAYTVEEES